MFLMEVRGFLFQGLLQNVLAEVILKWVTIFNLMEKVSNIICVCNCTCTVGMLWYMEEMRRLRNGRQFVNNKWGGMNSCNTLIN